MREPICSTPDGAIVRGPVIACCTCSTSCCPNAERSHLRKCRNRAKVASLKLHARRPGHYSQPSRATYPCVGCDTLVPLRKERCIEAHVLHEHSLALHLVLIRVYAPHQCRRVRGGLRSSRRQLAKSRRRNAWAAPN
ncbi:hypothetical protein JG687_00013676 [Phytophthora cactorum]|uniref:Uncharacterized protein n=1 Tax=Phytophthora cactorum TaxID=29920 RepID=A0A8T1TYQ8_9STRA|nr:hypothetical protein JG687_00013676 [Phytophthora cactorum]